MTDKTPVFQMTRPDLEDAFIACREERDSFRRVYETYNKPRLASHAEREDETAWLIERGQAFNQSPPLWWKFDEAKSTRPNAGYASYEELWTTNANEARRFKTKEAAEEYARREVYHFYQVTEHSWIAPSPAGPDALAEERLTREDYKAMWELAERRLAASEKLRTGLVDMLRSRPAQGDSK